MSDNLKSRPLSAEDLGMKNQNGSQTTAEEIQHTKAE